MEILQNRTPDRALSYEDISAVVEREYPRARWRVDRFRVGGPTPCYLVLISVLPTEWHFDGGKVPHELTGESAKLEWWQDDNHLVGAGFAEQIGIATDHALASARRHGLERCQITTWRDRLENRFRFFTRGPRYGAGFGYRPRGDEISRDLLALMLATGKR